MKALDVDFIVAMRYNISRLIRIPQETDVEATPENALLDGREVINGIGRRRKWTWSRLVVQPDGTTVTLLALFALERYGPWNSEKTYPIWIDGDSKNETLQNVALAERDAETKPRQRSTFGVPAGTKEYQKRWRARNKARMAAYQREYGMRIRAQARAYRQSHDESIQSVETSLQKKGQSLLEALLAETDEA
jgi:hypothetical protein